ncbi:hypothetical protein QBC41DRAFT_116515 [Cercophora samala]|uniref:Uncharacterized protein n=1 Tax=Cercophora samala TaxID=330535 RepID=A0AA40DHG4_9PEZI|nr:hypothetical protein QBC41DRAFT_116515 [Cercophora samala]
MQKTGIEKMLFGGEARLLSGRGKKRREGKSARKNKWSAGESGTSGWSGQRARASMMGNVSGQFEGKHSTESSESGSEVGISQVSEESQRENFAVRHLPSSCSAFPGDSGNSAGQSRNFTATTCLEVTEGTNNSTSNYSSSTAASSVMMARWGGMIHGSSSLFYGARSYRRTSWGSWVLDSSNKLVCWFCSNPTELSVLCH